MAAGDETATGPESLAADRFVILGLRWEDTPKIRVRRGGDRSSADEPLIGARLSFRVVDPSVRHCVGHSAPRSAPDEPDCPNRPESGSRTCVSCSVKDALHAGSLHHAHTKDRSLLDSDVLAHLAQPNRLYLAGFRDGSIKIGTSTAGRSEKRLLEQGAWVARFVAETDDGIAVREAEDRVTADLGVTQSVAVSRKLAGFDRPRTDEWLEHQLDELVARVNELLAVMADSRIRASTARWANPASGRELWNAVHRYPHRLDHGPHDLEVIDACGRVIAFRRPGDLSANDPGSGGSGDVFVADLGQLFGVELELGDFVLEPVTVQDSLF